MKGEINLLPTGETEARATLVYLRQAGRVLRLGMVGSIIMLLVPVISLFLSDRLAKSVATENDSDSERAELLEELSDTNQLLRSVRERVSISGEPSSRVPTIIKALPSNSSLTGLKFDAVTNTIEVLGTTTRRADIVQIQERLKELEDVQSVTAPLSNFQTGASTSFSLVIQYAL